MPNPPAVGSHTTQSQRSSSEQLHWLDADGGYAVALHNNKLVARNPRGTILKTVPPALRESPAVEQLRDLQEWLERHEREATATVESWMVRSLPVPTAALLALWPDPAWQSPLLDSVVSPLDRSGTPDREATGFLRGVDRERGLGLVTLDGETIWAAASTFLIPHPILIPELEDFRDFATELQIEQAISQLYRETWVKSPNLDLDAERLDTYAGAKFAKLVHATARARTLGYPVSGGFAVTSVFESGRSTEARYWLGADYPEEETWTGELIWVGAGSSRLKLSQVGPIAFSEGMRMAAAIYAGRVPEEEQPE